MSVPLSFSAASDAGIWERIHDFGPNPALLSLDVFRPAGLRPGAPLVLALHGCTQDGVRYDQDTGWSALAARWGFALLLPGQTRQNHPLGCFRWYEPAQTHRGGPEMTSLVAMVRWGWTALGCDPGRSFATGLSAGGAMTAALLATHPEMFAAGAILAALPFGAAASAPTALAAMRRPWPRRSQHWLRKALEAAGPEHPGSGVRRNWPRLSVWHGLADTIVHPGNGRELVKQWLALHGLDPLRSVETRIGNHHHRCFADPQGRIKLEAWWLAGMGHGVPVALAATPEPPSAPVEIRPHVFDVGLAASARIADFWGLTDTPATLLPGGTAPSSGTPFRRWSPPWDFLRRRLGFPPFRS